MKSQLIISLLAVLAFSSCTIPPENRNALIDAYPTIEVTSNIVLSNYLLGLDLALKMNEYIQAPDADKGVIEDKYFPLYKIRNEADTFSLIRYNEVQAKFITNGKDLKADASTWKLVFPYSSRLLWSVSQTMTMTVECVSTNKYSLTASDNTHWDGYVEHHSNDRTTVVLDSLSLQVENNKKEYSGEQVNNYFFTGTGDIIEYDNINNRDLKVKFTVPQGLNFFMKQSSFYDAQVDKYISNRNDNVYFKYYLGTILMNVEGINGYGALSEAIELSYGSYFTNQATVKYNGQIGYYNPFKDAYYYNY